MWGTFSTCPVWRHVENVPHIKRETDEVETALVWSVKRIADNGNATNGAWQHDSHAPNIAKDEDLLGEALLISLGSSIIGASRQTDCRISHAMARAQVAAVADAW
jgi:hypothetical protein